MEKYIHGFKVEYEDDVEKGINYLLYDLDREEAGVFFSQAKLRKYAKFEDDYEGQYTLTYNRDRTYSLTRRSR